MSTHALARTGTGATGAGVKTQIGADIIMPAGGPWIIHHLWGQVAKITTVPSEGTGGQLIVDSLSGDISPDPAPGKYPMVGNAATSGAAAGNSALPLDLRRVNWTAAGKASLKLSYLNQLAITTGSRTLGGIIFSEQVPDERPLMFCDGVFSSFASAAEQLIGTITLAEKATRIVGIMADLNKGDAVTSAEEIAATIRIASDDIKMPPAQYPCNRVFDAADGTAAGESAAPHSPFITVDIQVVGGARINIFATTTAAVTANADINVYIAYE